MGCLFTCFRFKDEEQRNASIVSKSIASKSTDVLNSKNQLASLLREEKGSPCDIHVEHLSSKDEIDGDSFETALQYEAKFLKNCGALVETPAEIRKTSRKTAPETFGEGLLSSDFHSWLPVESCQKLLWEEGPDRTSPSPGPVNNDSSPSANISECHKSEADYHEKPLPSVISSKSDHFEDYKQVSVVKSRPYSLAMDSSPDGDIPILISGCKHSPYPTPLKLTDEMQTPGTVYPSNAENTGKNARIQTQYVYPTLNPVENVSQWQMLIQPSHQLGPSSKRVADPDGRENVEQSSATPTVKISASSGSPELSWPNKGEHDTTYKEEFCDSPRSVVPQFDAREVAVNADNRQLVVSSLSHWLKPPTTHDQRSGDSSAIMKEPSYSKRSPKGDRPILGAVAAHWTDEDLSRVSPKWWDGNGIPNSTTKYKEDQKVNWHATPFEERLEKALSDEKLFPERKVLNGKPIKFEDDGEGEETDTAAS